MDRTPLEVLFIEDSQLDVELAVRALEQSGFAVHWKCVEIKDDLERALSGSKPQAILSDFSMPRLDGVEALRLVRKLAPSMPFIFVSGTIGEERAIETIRLGATDYVLKNNLRRLGPAVTRALADNADRERVRIAEEERARLVQILEATSDCVYVSDPDGRITYLNAAGRNFVGEPRTGEVERGVGDIHPQWARELIEREGRPSAAHSGVWAGETAIVSAGGTEIPVSEVIIAHRSPDGKVEFYSTIARDMRERKAYEARLQYFANYDPLTGLPNRTLLGDRTLQAMAHSRRAERPAALLVFDIDRFKLVNEIHSHGAGDALLRMFADRLRGIVREGDTIARLGADAFAVLATDLGKPDDILTVARKIQDSMRLPFWVEGRDIYVTVSSGASTFPRDGEEFDILLRNADAAMHRVKAEGGNGFQFYAAAMTRQATDRVEIENELRIALEKNALELHFQPQVKLSDGRMNGVEALMRWHHPTRGWVPPIQFVSIAEDSDLIHRLGEFALVEGCRQLRAWDESGLKLSRVAVNVSPHQFRNLAFVDTVARALDAAGLDPRRLELELTESVLVKNREAASVILMRLKALGVRIAVDDFGTGYSSLSYLSQLPIDCLKIDRSFVLKVNRRGGDAAIAQAILSLGHSLGLRVVAEGIQTVEQLEFLLSHGCEEGQGNYFSPAVKPDAILPLAKMGSLPFGKAVRSTVET